MIRCAAGLMIVMIGATIFTSPAVKLVPPSRRRSFAMATYVAYMRWKALPIPPRASRFHKQIGV